MVDGVDVRTLPVARAAPRHRLRHPADRACSRTARSRDNIATVPELARAGTRPASAARVDELVELVGLDPSCSAATRRRSRAASSSGSAWPGRWPPTRRCCSWTSPIGAVDPIVRARLQDELLALQRRVRKTIVLVTHDIDEAIKLADRIAILNVGGVLEQYGPPDELLREPANDFVGRLPRRRAGPQAPGAAAPSADVQLEPRARSWTPTPRRDEARPSDGRPRASTGSGCSTATGCSAGSGADDLDGVGDRSARPTPSRSPPWSTPTTAARGRRSTRIVTSRDPGGRRGRRRRHALPRACSPSTTSPRAIDAVTRAAAARWRPTSRSIRWDWVGDHTDEIWRGHCSSTCSSPCIAVVHRLRPRRCAARARRRCAGGGPTARSPACPACSTPSRAWPCSRCLVPITGLEHARPPRSRLVSYTLLILLRNIVAGRRRRARRGAEAADGMGYAPLAPASAASSCRWPRRRSSPGCASPPSPTIGLVTVTGARSATVATAASSTTGSTAASPPRSSSAPSCRSLLAVVLDLVPAVVRPSGCSRRGPAAERRR